MFDVPAYLAAPLEIPEDAKFVPKSPFMAWMLPEHHSAMCDGLKLFVMGWTSGYRDLTDSEKESFVAAVIRGTAVH